MKNLSDDVLSALPVKAFNYPHIFTTEEDGGREGRGVFNRTAAMLEGADVVHINTDNSFVVTYTDGGEYRSPTRIGVATNSTKILEAILASGKPVYVSRIDTDEMVLLEA